MNKKKTIITYLGTAVFLCLFQLIYHYFSHGVISNTLRYSFVVPLITLLFLVAGEKHLGTLRNRKAFNLISTGSAALIFGLVINGILSIAGATSPYLKGYFIAAAVFFLAGLICLFWVRSSSSLRHGRF